MKTFRSALRLGVMILIFAAGCAATKVNLTVKNPTPYDQDVRVVVSDKDGKPGQPIYLGTVGRDKEGSISFKVESKGFYTVQGLYQSVTVSEEKRSVMESSLKPVTQRMELKLTVAELDDKSAEEVLSNRFGELGPDRGFAPVPLSEALKTYYGALVVALPPDKGKKNPALQVIVSPQSFSAPVPEFSFVYHSNSDKKSQSVVLSGKTGATVGLPLVGSFNMESGADSVYKLGYKLEGYGWVPKIEREDWDLAHAVASLTPEQIRMINNLYKKHPGAQVLYINKMYAVKHAEFSLERGKKLTSEGQAGLDCVISLEGVYSFEKSETDKKEFNFFALNVDGVPVYLDTDGPGPTATISPADFLAAVGQGKVADVKAQLARDKSLAKAVGDDGRTGLHLAAEKNRMDQIELLAAAGADLNARDKKGDTPLHRAVRQGSREAALLLISKGADVNARAGGGLTPLALAAQAGDKDAVMLLLTAGADLKARDDQGNTPLHLAATSEIVKVLLNKGADANAKNILGQTPLHLARDPAVLKICLSKGGDPKARDEMGRTPLHYACSRDMAEALVGAGADVNVKDKEGKTPLALAFDQGLADVFEYLKSKGATTGGDAPVPDKPKDPEKPKTPEKPKDPEKPKTPEKAGPEPPAKAGPVPPIPSGP